MIPKREVQTDSGLAARCAAIASAGAGLIHFAVMPTHWLDWMLSGLFFAIIAVFQLMWAFLAWTRPRPLLLAVGMLANGGTAVLWVATRTAGLPFGPHAGVPEGIDAASICVLLLECYVVMGAGWAWLQDYEPEAVSRFRSALVLLGANGVIAGTVCVGVASSFTDHHDHHGPAEAQRGVPQAPHQHLPPMYQHSVPPVAPDSPPPAAQPGDEGLPVTDMGLHVDDPLPAGPSDAGAHPADHHHE